jgi:hypothetical protein
LRAGGSGVFGNWKAVTFSSLALGTWGIFSALEMRVDGLVEPQKPWGFHRISWDLPLIGTCGLLGMLYQNMNNMGVTTGRNGGFTNQNMGSNMIKLKDST